LPYKAPIGSGGRQTAGKISGRDPNNQPTKGSKVIRRFTAQKSRSAGELCPAIFAAINQHWSAACRYLCIPMSDVPSDHLPTGTRNVLIGSEPLTPIATGEPAKFAPHAASLALATKNIKCGCQ
jgi:hypothetical protein